MKARRSSSLLLALLLIVGGALTVGLLSLDVMSNLTGSIPPQPDTDQIHIVEESAYGMLPDPFPLISLREKGLPRATVLFQAERLNPDKGTLSATLTVTLPEELEERIFDGTRKIFVKGSGKEEEYADQALQLQVRNRIGGPSFSALVPLESILGKRRYQVREETDFSVAADLHVMGSVRFFPSDWYWLNTFVSLELPSNLMIVDPDEGFKFFVPIELKVASSPGMAGKRMAIEKAEEDEYLTTLNVLVTRSPSVKRFVYLIAAIPFALIAVLVHLLFFSSRRGDPQEASTFLVEMVAAMLAILPLREVIVPGDIEGLTRVDLILGFALVLIVSLALTRFSLNLLSRETPAAALEVERKVEEVPASSAPPPDGGPGSKPAEGEHERRSP